MAFYYCLVCWEIHWNEMTALVFVAQMRSRNRGGDLQVIHRCCRWKLRPCLRLHQAVFEQWQELCVIGGPLSLSLGHPKHWPRLARLGAYSRLHSAGSLPMQVTACLKTRERLLECARDIAAPMTTIEHYMWLAARIRLQAAFSRCAGDG